MNRRSFLSLIGLAPIAGAGAAKALAEDVPPLVYYPSPYFSADNAVLREGMFLRVDGTWSTPPWNFVGSYDWSSHSGDVIR